MEEYKVVSPSGATSSGVRPAHHLVPQELYEDIALRYGLGKDTHGDVNYQKCINMQSDGSVLVDVEFVRARYDHAVSHLLEFKTKGNNVEVQGPGGNRGALGWWLGFTAWFEKSMAGYSWSWDRVLNPETVNENWVRFSRLDFETHSL